jgi:hypothetical protein
LLFLQRLNLAKDAVFARRFDGDRRLIANKLTGSGPAHANILTL